MIRYTWSWKDGRKIYKSFPFIAQEGIDLPYQENPIFVNILKSQTHNGMTAIKVKLFYNNGSTFEGWTSDLTPTIGLFNSHELFDGRFNQ